MLSNALIASGAGYNAASAVAIAKQFTTAGNSSFVDLSGINAKTGLPANLATISAVNAALKTSGAESYITTQSPTDFQANYNAQVVTPVLDSPSLAPAVQAALADPVAGQLLQTYLADYNNQYGIGTTGPSDFTYTLLMTGSVSINNGTYGSVPLSLDKSSPLATVRSIMQLSTDSKYAANGHLGDVERRLQNDVTGAFQFLQKNGVATPASGLSVNSAYSSAPLQLGTPSNTTSPASFSGTQFGPLGSGISNISYSGTVSPNAAQATWILNTITSLSSGQSTVETDNGTGPTSSTVGTYGGANGTGPLESMIETLVPTAPGQSDSVTASNAIVNMGYGTTAAISGNNDVVQTNPGDNLGIGTNEAVTVNGGGATVNASSGSSTLLQSGGGYVYTGTGASVTAGTYTNGIIDGGSGLTASTGSNSSWTFNGGSTVINAANGAYTSLQSGGNFTFDGTGSVLSAGNYTNGTINGGSGLSVYTGSNSSWTFNGGGATVNASGGGYAVLQNGGNYIFNGTGTTVNTGTYTNGTINGGSGLTAYTGSNSSWTVNGGGATVNAASNGYTVLQGGGNYTFNGTGTVLSTGTYTNGTINGGSGLTAYTGSNSSWTVNGGGTTVDAASNGYTVLQNGGNYTFNGTGTVLSAGAYTNGTINGGSGLTAYTGSNSSWAVNGGGATVNAGNSAYTNVQNGTGYTLNGGATSYSVGNGTSGTLNDTGATVRAGTNANWVVNGANDSVTTSSGTQITFIGGQSQLSSDVYNFSSGVRVTYDNTSTGGSQVQVSDPSSSAYVSYSDHTGYNGTGTQQNTTTDNNNGTSQTTLYNPASGVRQETGTFSGPDDSGNMTSRTIVTTNGDTYVQNSQYNGSSLLDFYQQVYNPNGVQIFDDEYNSNDQVISQIQGDTPAYTLNFTLTPSYGLASGLSSKGAGIDVIAQYDVAQGNAAAAQAAITARGQADAIIDGNLPAGPTPPPLANATWSTGSPITVSLADLSGATSQSGGMSMIYDSTVSKAVQDWSTASGLNLKLVGSTAGADINVGWGNLDTESSGVAGVTTSGSAMGRLVPGVQVLFEDPTQDALAPGAGAALTYSGTDVQLYQLALHEIGHALGLADSTDIHSVMYASLGAANRALDAADISNIKSLYGGGPSTIKASTSSFSLLSGHLMG